MYQIDEFYLMHKNDKVAKFTMTDYGTNINVTEIYNKKLMPYGTRVTERTLNEKFTEWKNDRRISVERPYIMQIYKKTKMSIPELETKNLGLSMCDCYWFQPSNEDNDWKKINFYQNGFSEEIGRMLMNINSDTPSNLKTPDIMLSGECPKMWSRFNGTTYLLKGCRFYSDTKIEVCNDVFASLLAEKLGINTVQSYIMKSGDKFDFSCSETFIKNDSLEFVSFKQIGCDTETYGINGVLKFMKEHNMQEYLNHLIVIDFLIGNYNRTLADIGILVDSDTLEFVRPAPLFDYEESLDYNLFDNDISGVFEHDINEQLKMVSDFSWIDFDAIENTIQEIDRIYSFGNVKSPEINEIKKYFRNRINLLKKVIPPEQIRKRRKIEPITKPPHKNKHEDKGIKIYTYTEN